jgi:hypothetical protein
MDDFAAMDRAVEWVTATQADRVLAETAERYGMPVEVLSMQVDDPDGAYETTEPVDAYFTQMGKLAHDALHG